MQAEQAILVEHDVSAETILRVCAGCGKEFVLTYMSWCQTCARDNWRIVSNIECVFSKIIIFLTGKCWFMPKNIPIEKAAELCKKHRDKHKVRLFSQCWGCLKYSKEEPSKMCFYNEKNPTENRGCKFVSKLFDESE